MTDTSRIDTRVAELEANIATLEAALTQSGAVRSYTLQGSHSKTSSTPAEITALIATYRRELAMLLKVKAGITPCVMRSEGTIYV